MGDQGKIGPFRAWIKKNNTRLLRISALLFALCYVLSYKGGVSDDPKFMGVSLAVLTLANVMAAILK